jgi:6-phospho-3-hexuloisomerase
MKSLKTKTNAVISEIKQCLASVSDKQTQKLINEIILAQRVFLVAIGRVNLSLQCFGKRLAHLGIKVELVGSLTEKPATSKDLLIVASGSGESLIPVQIVKKAKSIGCKIFLITSAKKSTIKKMSNFYVELKTPTKKDFTNNLNESLFDSASKSQKSVQPMSSLFDQALHIYGDIVSLGIIDKLKINKNKLWKHHANLE